jgi:dihydroxyacid dehydratase/phosphogluconate dehydratase
LKRDLVGLISIVDVTDMRFSLVSRDVIADSIETVMGHNGT